MLVTTAILVSDSLEAMDIKSCRLCKILVNVKLAALKSLYFN